MLVGPTQSGETRELRYDAASELTSMIVRRPTGAQDPWTGEDILSSTTTTYGYDANGNRTTDSSKASPYVYDDGDRLTGHGASTYRYDGDGLRTKKTTSAGSRTHTWDVSEQIAEMIGDAGTAYITDPDGMPMAQISPSGAVHYYHHDQLGCTRALTSSTATVAATFSFGPCGAPATSTATISTPFGFAGQYTDSETGFQYLRARYHDPATYNFLTRDPLNAQTRAPYNYADNNPTNNTDPTGLIACIAKAITGGIGAAAKAGPKFTQRTASETFGHGPFAGRSIGDVARGLRSGGISPGDLPIEVIRRGGETLTLNTRSTLALRRGGVDPSDWVIRDVSGNAAREQLLTRRLARNRLDGGIDVLRITGAGRNASSLR